MRKKRVRSGKEEVFKEKKRWGKKRKKKQEAAQMNANEDVEGK